MESRRQSAPVTYTIPGTYGQPPIRLTAGEGRLARPLFRFTGSAGVGYDDNVLQTPTRSPSTSTEQIVKEVVAPATGAHTTVVQVQQADGTIVPETVEVPASPATTVGVTVPGVPAAEERSGVRWTRANVGADVQFANRTTVFTFDLNGLGDGLLLEPSRLSQRLGLQTARSRPRISSQVLRPSGRSRRMSMLPTSRSPISPSSIRRRTTMSALT